jgi:hypothetical protein
MRHCSAAGDFVFLVSARERAVLNGDRTSSYHCRGALDATRLGGTLWHDTKHKCNVINWIFPDKGEALDWLVYGSINQSNLFKQYNK